MTGPVFRLLAVIATAALLAACASAPTSEMPASVDAAKSADAKSDAKPDDKTGAKPDAKPSRSAAKPAEPEEEAEPLKSYEAAGQCWMKYDKANTSLEGKAKLVDKCVEEKMKADAKKR